MVFFENGGFYSALKYKTSGNLHHFHKYRRKREKEPKAFICQGLALHTGKGPPRGTNQATNITACYCI